MLDYHMMEEAAELLTIQLRRGPYLIVAEERIHHEEFHVLKMFFLQLIASIR